MTTWTCSRQPGDEPDHHELTDPTDDTAALADELTAAYSDALWRNADRWSEALTGAVELQAGAPTTDGTRAMVAAIVNEYRADIAARLAALPDPTRAPILDAGRPVRWVSAPWSSRPAR